MAEGRGSLDKLQFGDVVCDACIGKKVKAVKSCLFCLVSYCEPHLQPHYESPAFKRHKLVKPTGDLQERICCVHDKLLEVYCHTDQQCICLWCAMKEHKEHKILSAAAERTEKQKRLEPTRSVFHRRIEEREKELQDLRQAVQSLKRSAQEAVEESERMFTELIRSIEKRRSEVKQLIRGQEEAEVSRAEGLLKQLEQEIAELRRGDAELEQLSRTDDHIHFLQRSQALFASSEDEDALNITVNPHISFEAVRNSVCELKNQLEDICEREFIKISQTAGIVCTLEPRIREDFLKYSCPLTLDPNTAYKRLQLSQRNREVICVEENESYPDHPERFDYWPQVLCREGLSGRCYWEVEWGGDGVSVAVSYKDISRKGKGYDCTLGYNDKSWRLRCSPTSYSFLHDNKRIEIPVPPSSSTRIGVYLDHRAGTLAFYSISDSMSLLHRVQTTFAQPLYPGFWFECGLFWITGSSVKLCDLK